MKNILLISTTSQVGGGPKHLLDLLHGLDRNKYRPIVIAPNDGEYFERFLQEAKVYEMNLRKDISGNIREIKNILAVEDIDVVHSHGMLAGIYGRAVKNKNVKVVHTFHGIYFENRNAVSQLAIKEMYRLLEPRTDAFIAVSKEEAKEAERLGFAKSNKLHVIYNGVDPEKFNVEIDVSDYRKNIGLNSTDYVIGYVARFSDFKGHTDLIKAFKDVSSKIQNAKLLLVGDGNTRAEAENLVNELGLTQKAVFLGQRNDVPELLKCMDMFVSPSHKEGMPYNLIEAMAAGLPLVATNVTGNSEVIVDEKNGLLCEPYNYLSLYEAIEKYCANDKNERDRLVSNGKKIVNEKFSEKEMIRRTQEVYDKLS